MEVQSPIKHHIAGAKHNNLSHTRQLCPHVGPMKAMLFGFVWVRPATLPHLYKTLGFFRARSPLSSNILSMYQKWGPNRHYPIVVGAGSPQ